MKKNLTKKLMLSVLTLAFAVVSLGASTFAWFTLSKDAKINAFDMTVKAGSGIEMRLVSYDKGTDDKYKVSDWYTSELPTTVVEEFVKSTERLDAVTAKCTDDNKLDYIVNKDGSTPNSTFIAGGSYVAFKVQFRLSNASDKASYKLELNDYTLATKGSVNEWVSNIDYVGKDGNAEDYKVSSTHKYYVSDAARLAIKVTGGNQFIYQNTDQTGHNEWTTGQPTTNNAAVNYYNAITYGTDNDIKPEELAKAPQYATNTLPAGGQELGSVGQLLDDAEYALELTVFVWIEGWDGECMNAIFAQTLTTALSFELPDAGKIQ